MTISPQNEMSDRAVGNRLRHLRTTAHLAQKSAGRLIGVSSPTYANIEKGWRSLKPREAAAFAERYGVDVRWIQCGLSSKECKLVDVSREPDPVTLPPARKVSTPFINPFRKVG